MTGVMSKNGVLKDVLEITIKPSFHIAVMIGRLPAMRRRSIAETSQIVLF